MQKGASLAASATFPWSVRRPMGSYSAQDLEKSLYLFDGLTGAHLFGSIQIYADVVFEDRFLRL